MYKFADCTILRDFAYISYLCLFIFDSNQIGATQIHGKKLINPLSFFKLLFDNLRRENAADKEMVQS